MTENVRVYTVTPVGCLYRRDFIFTRDNNVILPPLPSYCGVPDEKFIPDRLALVPGDANVLSPVDASQRKCGEVVRPIGRVRTQEGHYPYGGPTYVVISASELPFETFEEYKRGMLAADNARKRITKMCDDDIERLKKQRDEELSRIKTPSLTDLLPK
ncbi:hypothetical protein J4207_03085 [Candidatus Woesearchaeota archaeon]|nr:hypothetical protein [Candidatus Woesearchaeota archaeon]